MLREYEHASAEAAIAALAEALESALRDALAARSRASLVVSGGRTPARVLPLLAEADLDWSRVVVTLTDERWVAPGHEDSTEGLVRRSLLRGAASRARFIGLWTESADPTDAVAGRTAALAEVPIPYDLVFSGIGEDGHVASLFPDDPAWHVAEGLLHPVAATPIRGARLGLTAWALLNARMHCLFVSGAKRDVYRRIRKSGEDHIGLPAAALLNQDRVPVSVFLAP